jgi:hypothetical protein
MFCVGAELMTSIADFRGGFIWRFWPRLRSQVYPIDWDFRNKPLEKALELWYSDEPPTEVRRSPHPREVAHTSFGAGTEHPE